MRYTLMMVLALLLTSFLNAAAQQVYNYTLTATALGMGEQNVGPSFESDLWGDGGNLTLSAVTKIGQPNLPDGMPGTIYLSNYGAGVQNLWKKGSKGISGTGPDGDEALVFDFTKTPIVTSSPVLFLNDFSAAYDDTSLVVRLADGSTVNVPAASIEGAAQRVREGANCGGSLYRVAFKDLRELSGKGPLSGFTVLESTGHTYVYAVRDVQEVPEPGTMAAFALGACGLAYLRQRRRAAS